MIEAIAAYLLGGGLITLLVDGAKQLSAVYDRAAAVSKHVLVWGSAVVFLLLLRGFDLPGSAFGWLWFVLSIAIVALVAYGWFRLRQATVGAHLALNEDDIIQPPLSPRRPSSGPLT